MINKDIILVAGKQTILKVIHVRYSIVMYKKSLHLLFIEDDPDQWAVIKYAVREVIPAQNCLSIHSFGEFTEELNSGKLIVNSSLIILDLYLPGKEAGLRILKTLKSPDSPYRYIPVLILSHSGAAEDVADAYLAGCSSYHQKPVDMQDWLWCSQLVGQLLG